MKQKILELWEKRERYLVPALVLALVFVWGAVVGSLWESQRQAEEQEQEQIHSLRHVKTCLESVTWLHGHSDRSIPLAENKVATVDVVSLRKAVSILDHTLPSMTVRLKGYPEVHDYLYWLCQYIVYAECPSIESLGPLLEVSQPLMEGVRYAGDLEEALAGIADQLDTEQGEAILQTLVPHYEADD